MNESMFDVAARGAVGSLRAGTRKRIMNDILYYLRKLLKLARKAQTIGEGASYEDIENNRIMEEIEFIRNQILEIEEEIG